MDYGRISELARRVIEGTATIARLDHDEEQGRIAGDCQNVDAITVPVFYDVPYFSKIQIDDGAEVKDKPIGSGNGNGKAEASEQIMIYENGQRLRLYTDDPYVETASELLFDEVLKGIWSDGFTLSSIVKIADNCPSGHTIEFLANYETKEFMPIRREVHWGKVKVTVK